jgi:hypothetical protein
MRILLFAALVTLTIGLTAGAPTIAAPAIGRAIVKDAAPSLVTPAPAPGAAFAAHGAASCAGCAGKLAGPQRSRASGSGMASLQVAHGEIMRQGTLAVFGRPASVPASFVIACCSGSLVAVAHVVDALGPMRWFCP